MIDDFLNQLVGLCAGREALLRLERRRLFLRFQTLPDGDEHKDGSVSDRQLCVDLTVASANANNETLRCSSLEGRERPNHATMLHQRPERHLSGEIFGVFDPYELLRTELSPISMRTQQAQQVHNSILLPTLSGEHKTSFPSFLVPTPPPVPCFDSYKINRRRKNHARRGTDAVSSEAVDASQEHNNPPPTTVDSHRIPAILRHVNTDAKHQKHSTAFVCLDSFEADMKILTMKLIREMWSRPEIILPGLEKRHRVRIEVDAAGTSAAELKQARQSTAFRSDYGLQYQFPDAGRVDVYKYVCPKEKSR